MIKRSIARKGGESPGANRGRGAGTRDLSSLPEADAHLPEERAAVQDAHTQFLAALIDLHGELADLTGVRSPRLKRLQLKRQAILSGLERQARGALKAYAYVDGEPVDAADDRLLQAFYADPRDAVAARYAWALLQSTNAPSFAARLIAATRSEYAQFLACQEAGRQLAGSGDHLAQLLVAEEAHAKRTDRLAYRLALLQRLAPVRRGGSAAERSAIDAEIAAATKVLERGKGTLRLIRRARISLGARTFLR